jgi:CubicO group peptidase (beta-lactamase class C family)
MKISKRTLLLWFLILVGCSSDDPPTGPVEDYAYRQPEQVGDGWETSTLSAEGVDVEVINSMMQTILTNDYDFLRSILIARNGKLIFEEYFNGVDMGSMNHIQSATKSITSALIGIAIDKGFIEDVEGYLFPFFPEYDHLRDAEKDKITLDHVLSMTPGFAWDEVSTNVIGEENDNIIGHNRNYIEHVLGKPVVHEPGTYWYYNSGCPVLLGGIIRNTLDMQPEAFARSHLFGPLAIDDWSWPGLYYTDNLTGTHGALYLKARDMAKIGQLFLNDGLWNNRRVISEEWISESTRSHVTVGGDIEYGYLWWIRQIQNHHVFYADGYGGQQIVIVPQGQMVIVTTASYEHLFSQGASAHSIQRNAIWNLISDIIRAI